MARQIATALFAELPMLRRRELISAVAHYVAGVLDRESMVRVVEELSRGADLKAGNRVKTLRGTLRGVIVKVLEDGRVVWRPDGGASELTALPESLASDD